MIKYVLAIALLTTSSTFALDNQAAERINKDVRRELITLPFLNVFDNLAYRIDGSSVILSGQVTRPILKSDAERVVKRIEGVATVENQIEVLPVSQNDDRLRWSLYHAIYRYPALHRYSLPPHKPIRIIVKNGHVTLEGFVASESDKHIANLRANGVHGVFSVSNNLRIDGQPVV
jgi:hyperosmotically inducible protein